MDNKTVLSVKNMNISFKQHCGEKVIVRNGEFEVKSGEFVLILGENGSGKSSIFRSLIREDESRNNDRDLFFNGELIDTDEKLDVFRRSIGYAKQEDDPDAFFSRKVGDYVYDYAEKSEYFTNRNELKVEIDEVFNALRCDKYSDGNLKDLRLKTCSGGEKRIATLLSALSRTKSDLFILDEPINNLDAYHARILNNYLNRLKKKDNPPGILVITHCHMFQNVDRVYKLSKGKLEEVFDYKPKSCYGDCDDCGFYTEEE